MLSARITQLADFGNRTTFSVADARDGCDLELLSLGKLRERSASLGHHRIAGIVRDDEVTSSIRLTESHPCLLGVVVELPRHVHDVRLRSQRSQLTGESPINDEEPISRMPVREGCDLVDGIRPFALAACSREGRQRPRVNGNIGQGDGNDDGDVPRAVELIA